MALGYNILSNWGDRTFFMLEVPPLPIPRVLDARSKGFQAPLISTNAYYPTGIEKS
jgi:hypothetical protein